MPATTAPQEKQSASPQQQQPPQPTSRLTARRFRLLRAYQVVFRLLISLGWFEFKGKFFGSEWKARKMPDVYGANARRLKETILVLKGLFIKAGQMISILSNFLPEDFRNELEELQDRIPSRPFAEIRTRIQQEFGQPPETLFQEFSEIPIASASLAQVHRATLPDGRIVAVKVQYPEIEEIARMDLITIRRIIRIVSFIFRVRGMDDNFSQIEEMIHDELDFRKEADHINTIRENFVGDTQVSFPQVVAALSSERVLTTEFIEGVKISNLAAIAELGIDRQDLAERVLTAYCQMIFSDGFYHADPHPGNILVRPDGSVVFIDFGAVASLSAKMLEGIPQFLEGLLRRNTEQIMKALTMMGFIPRNEDSYNAERIIEYFYSRFLEEMTLDSWNLQDIQVDFRTRLEVWGDLRRMNISLRELAGSFHLPKDWVLLERTILLLMGLCTHLSPTMNPMKTIRPYLEEFVLGRDRDWVKMASNVVKDMALSALTIPESLKKFLQKANNDELSLNIKGLQESTQLFYALGHQFLYGIFALAAGGLSYFAHIRAEEMISQGLLGTAAFFMCCLGGSLWSARRFRRKNMSRR